MEDYFLKIDGIPGESVDAEHKDEIELASFSWGLVEVPAHSGHGARRPEFNGLHFTTHVSKASPQLFLATASGKHIKEANLSVRRAAGKEGLEYLKIKLGDVLVTSFEEGAGGENAPQESVGLAFTRIDVEYRPIEANGTLGAPISAGWDLSQHVKV